MLMNGRDQEKIESGKRLPCTEALLSTRSLDDRINDDVLSSPLEHLTWT